MNNLPIPESVLEYLKNYYKLQKEKQLSQQKIKDEDVLTLSNSGYLKPLVLDPSTEENFIENFIDFYYQKNHTMPSIFECCEFIDCIDFKRSFKTDCIEFKESFEEELLLGLLR